MSQLTSGLRFDIYERVHLPENTVGMRELNGIELTPAISVVAQGEQAVLSGHLLLSGTYTGEDESRIEGQLTHRIPVEITLPMNRIRNVNDIRVDIENFDVDLLSARTLNVTGVLSLDGIEMAVEAEGKWREEEQMSFSHRAGEPEVEVPTAPIQPEAESSEDGQRTDAIAAQPAPARDEPERESDELVVAGKEEKSEIKIAFSGKPSNIEERPPIGVNEIMTMAGGASAVQPQAAPLETQEAVLAAMSPASEPSSSETKDRLEWKKLFLQRDKDVPAFRKVKMCIAQKEDTIETIANRYAKNPRELMLYNRINDQYLQEGQVVYIP